eukprot:56598-Eustigmatos_ZCMA.PRE.1
MSSPRIDHHSSDVRTRQSNRPLPLVDAAENPQPQYRCRFQPVSPVYLVWYCAVPFGHMCDCKWEFTIP